MQRKTVRRQTGSPGVIRGSTSPEVREEARRPGVLPASTAFALGLAFLSALLPSAGCGGAAGVTAEPARVDLALPFVSAAPGDVGLDGGGLAAAEARAAAIPRFRSLIVARHGRLAFERYFATTSADTLFDVRSVTKSVVSALTGIAVAEGALPGVEVPMAPYLAPAYTLPPGDAAVTVRHLLTMTSGFEWNDDVDYNPWILSRDHVEYLLGRPQSHVPGTYFTYNSAAVHVLGVVVQRATGEPLAQYAAERLFAPLGIDAVAWESLEGGTVNGGSGIQLRGRELLKLGQLFLQRGWSRDHSVVPEAWVDQATAAQFPWRDTYGAQRSVTYGLLWWVSDAAPPASFAWGYGGQFVYVVPSLDLVVVTTTEWRDLRELDPVALAEQVLGVIVEEVLPAAR